MAPRLPWVGPLFVALLGFASAAHAQAGPLGRPPVIDDRPTPEPTGDVLADPERLTLEEQESLRATEGAGTAVGALCGAGVGLTAVGAFLVLLSSQAGREIRGTSIGVGPTGWHPGLAIAAMATVGTGLLSFIVAVIVEGVRAGARGGLDARVRERLHREARDARAESSVALFSASF